MEIAIGTKVSSNSLAVTISKNQSSFKKHAKRKGFSSAEYYSRVIVNLVVGLTFFLTNEKNIRCRQSVPSSRLPPLPCALCILHLN